MPTTFERNIVDLHGPQGEAWLAALPVTIADLERRWGFIAQPAFPNLSYNYAAPAVLADGTPAVLKLGVPGDRAAVNEIQALRLFDGQGIVRLLAAEPGESAMLLERLQPGVMLSTLDDDEAATRIAAGVMRALWIPAPEAHDFETVAGWAAGFERLRAMFGGGTGPLPAGLVSRAEAYFADFLGGGDPPLVLHGDLHHYNILSAERAPWLAIDPKGLVGPAGYEVGPLLYNPIGVCLTVPDPKRLLAWRVAVLAEMLSIERHLVARWGVAAAMLSAWWSVEDHGERDEGVLVCAEILEEMA